jgi:NifB/MoaA-like Fe-S oxidoreductase
VAIIEELRTPLYFAAGTADLAVRQARKVPGLIEQIAAEAPARIDAVRNTDPKAVQEKVTVQAKEAQAKVTEVLGSLDTDLKKLGENAQHLALRGVGVAAEYAVRAREAYEKVAEHGEQAVRQWRGEAAEEINEIAIAVEPDPEPKAAESEAEAPAAKKAAQAKKAPAPRKPAAKKATASDS